MCLNNEIVLKIKQEKNDLQNCITVFTESVIKWIF